MRSLMMMVVLLGAWCGPGASARAATVRVLETHPSGAQVMLGRNENFYLRLAYVADEPVHIWARPYFRGKEVDAGSNPSRTYVGNGETFGWFFLMQPGAEVDEIRITAGDGRASNTPVVARHRVHVVGSAGPVADRAEPAWVLEMKQLAEQAQRENLQARRSAPTGPGDVALFSGFMLAMVGLGVFGFAAPAWGVWRWQGRWRIAAAVPAAVMVFVVMRIAAGLMRDPTSHNLWPFEILQAGLLSVVVMLALLLARRISASKR